MVRRTVPSLVMRRCSSSNHARAFGRSAMSATAMLVRVVFLAAEAAAERGDQGHELLRGQHLGETRLFDGEDFALERQDGLVAPVAPLLGGPAGRVTLNDE